MANEKKTEITVTAAQDSRWRAGLNFTREPRTVEVTDAQLDVIKADPRLVIITPDDEDGGTKGSGSKKGK